MRVISEDEYEKLLRDKVELQRIKDLNLDKLFTLKDMQNAFNGDTTWMDKWEVTWQDTLGKLRIKIDSLEQKLIDKQCEIKNLKKQVKELEIRNNRLAKQLSQYNEEGTMIIVKNTQDNIDW